MFGLPLPFVIAAACVIAFLFAMSIATTWFRKVGPNQALIVYGVVAIRHENATIGVARVGRPLGSVVSEVKVNSDLNFLSHGGPHLVVLNPTATRVAFSNYFVDLSLGFNFPGANLSLHGTGSNGDHRVYIANFNPTTHKLELDPSFRDENDGLPGVNFNRIQWPHGNSGYAKPHGLIFVE